MSSVKIRNNCTATELWIEFFEFYSLGFNVNDDVVSVRNVGGFSRDEKRWKGKKLAIEGEINQGLAEWVLLKLNYVAHFKSSRHSFGHFTARSFLVRHVSAVKLSKNGLYEVCF